MTVAIPKGRKRGRPAPETSFAKKFVTSIGKFFSISIFDDPTKGFSIPENGVLVFPTEMEFLVAVKTFGMLNNYHNDHAFVFIHGYNTSFDEAAFRTAQLAYDLGTSGYSFGTPFFYSWPSLGSAKGYMGSMEFTVGSHGGSVNPPPLGGGPAMFELCLGYGELQT